MRLGQLSLLSMLQRLSLDLRSLPAFPCMKSFIPKVCLDDKGISFAHSHASITISLHTHTQEQLSILFEALTASLATSSISKSTGKPVLLPGQLIIANHNHVYRPKRTIRAHTHSSRRPIQNTTSKKLTQTTNTSSTSYSLNTPLNAHPRLRQSQTSQADLHPLPTSLHLRPRHRRPMLSQLEPDLKLQTR